MRHEIDICVLYRPNSTTSLAVCPPVLAPDTQIVLPVYLIKLNCSFMLLVNFQSSVPKTGLKASVVHVPKCTCVCVFSRAKLLVLLNVHPLPLLDKNLAGKEACHCVG